MEQQAISVLQLNKIIAEALTVEPRLHNVWVVGETSDLRVAGGHCYLELLEKDERGTVVARIRAAIWAQTYAVLAPKFQAATGVPLASGQKVMMLLNVNYHPAFGLTAVVSLINPAYTVGDAVRRRLEILERLKSEGIMEQNRNIKWPVPAQRIAIISARGAAGYGDFINQLYTNKPCLAFTSRLFEATMQGERTVPTILDALERIRCEAEQWDCVVIIRGGGATSELGAFDSYDLAAAIARFPKPVIIGIGHERDITVLDYVANMRVKTPTAAAQWLIHNGELRLDELSRIANAIYQSVSSSIQGNREQIAYLSAIVPSLVTQRISDIHSRIDRATTLMSTLSATLITPRLDSLNRMASDISDATGQALQRSGDKLRSLEELISALSPESTLARGYSLTRRVGGKVVTSSAELRDGDAIETFFADGSATSIVNNINNNKITQQ